MTPNTRAADLQQFTERANREFFADRWADAYRHHGLNLPTPTNDQRANRGNQARRVAHQLRQAERRLTWMERCKLECIRWSSKNGKGVN